MFGFNEIVSHLQTIERKKRGYNFREISKTRHTYQRCRHKLWSRQFWCVYLTGNLGRKERLKESRAKNKLRASKVPCYEFTQA